MKLYSKEALTLGGIYLIISSPFAFFNSETLQVIDMVLFWGFIVLLFKLLFSKKVDLIDKFNTNYPKLSNYIQSIGWLPYFWIIVGAFLLAYTAISNPVENEYAWILPFTDNVGIINLILVAISLSLNFFRSKFSKK